MRRLTMIAAVGAQSRVIGRNNDLPWSKDLKPDMQRFKALTLEGVVFMGKNTWYSIPEKFRPLPRRVNLIISSTMSTIPEGVLVFPTLGDAILHASHHFARLEGFIIGGARLYEEGMAYADRLEITEVGEDPPGDVFFPDYSAFSKIVAETIEPDFSPQLKYRTLERP